MIEFSVASSGLEFNELAQKLSGPFKQKLIERLTDIAFAAAFWGAPVKWGYLASTVYKEVSGDQGVVGAAASYAKFVVEGTAPHEIRSINGGFWRFRLPVKWSLRLLCIIQAHGQIHSWSVQLMKHVAKLIRFLLICGLSW